AAGTAIPCSGCHARLRIAAAPAPAADWRNPPPDAFEPAAPWEVIAPPAPPPAAATAPAAHHPALDSFETAFPVVQWALILAAIGLGFWYLGGPDVREVFRDIARSATR